MSKELEKLQELADKALKACVAKTRRNDADPTDDPERIRRIIRLASTMTRIPQLKSWLMNDEFGGWERDTKKLLERGRGVAYGVYGPDVSPERLDKAIATELVIQGGEALLANAKKKSKRRR